MFAVGGWSDGYRDMVFRVVEHVRGPVRGLIGPWGHTSPENGAPGPAIGFLQECVRFFAASLDGVDNGFFDEPRLISYMQEPVAPAGSYVAAAGDDGSPTSAGRRRLSTRGDTCSARGRCYRTDSGEQADTTRSLRGLQAHRGRRRRLVR